MSRIGNPFAALISRLQRARVEDQSIAPRARTQSATPPPVADETTNQRPAVFRPVALDAAHTARVGFNQADRLRASLFSMFRPSAAPATPAVASATATATGATQTVTGSAAPNATIRDFQTTASTIAINDDLKTTGVRVDVNIAHSYASDLVVKLRSPEGREVVLRNREGGRGNGTVSFTANPADFNGTSTKGNWTLVVEDRAGEDVGTLRNWSLALTGTRPAIEPPPVNGTRTVTQTATPNAAIRDFQTTTSTIAINDDLKATGVRVDVNIAHTYAGDLVVKLRSPQGQEVTLRNREGGRGNGVVSFAANPSDFNGIDAKGDWTLIVEDRDRGDVGTLRSWSLSVTGTDRAPVPPRPTPPPDNSPLLLGNPSNATDDVRNENNYLIVRDQFTASYSRADAKPNWVAWHLEQSHLGRESRGKFDENSTDNQLPEGWRRITTFDYTGSGYDRGHHLPSADRTASREANNGTFIMTNVLPQAPDNNQGPWERMERYVRDQVRQHDMEAYVVMGSYGEVGRIPGQGGDANIAIPEQVWKVVVLIPRGDNDLERINRDAQVIAVDMPNRQGIRNDNWENYRVSVADIERVTGHQFFTNLPPDVQAALRDKGR